MQRYTFSDYCKVGTDENGFSIYGDVTDPSGYASLYLGDLHPDKEGEFYEIEYCGGSDGSGDSVTVANFRAIKKEFESWMEKGIWEYYGGYGTYGLVYNPSMLPPEVLERLEEIIKKLDDYPVLDEDEWSQVEIEAQDEAWDNWVEWEFRRRIAQLFRDNNLYFDYDGDDGGALYDFFRYMTEKFNCEWINETGNSMYIDVERALPSFEVVHAAMFDWYETWLKWHEDCTENPFASMISTIEEPE